MMMMMRRRRRRRKHIFKRPVLQLHIIYYIHGFTPGGG